MIELFEIFWSAPIELRVIILGVPIAFTLMNYFEKKGIKI